MNPPRRKPSPKSARRRSAPQWAKLVAAWRASGLDAETFAAQHRITLQSLRWWRWRLGHPTVASATGPAELRLVPVTLADERSSISSTSAWEICTPSGLLLRVHLDRDRALFDRALAHLTSRS